MLARLQIAARLPLVCHAGALEPAARTRVVYIARRQSDASFLQAVAIRLRGSQCDRFSQRGTPFLVLSTATGGDDMFAPSARTLSVVCPVVSGSGRGRPKIGPISPSGRPQAELKSPPEAPQTHPGPTTCSISGKHRVLCCYWCYWCCIGVVLVLHGDGLRIRGVLYMRCVLSTYAWTYLAYRISCECRRMSATPSTRVFCRLLARFGARPLPVHPSSSNTLYMALVAIEPGVLRDAGGRTSDA